MIPVPLIVLLSSSGGAVLGFALRQPEINRLKKQVRELQRDNSKLRKIMCEQQEAYENLLVAYGELKFYQLIEKRKLKQNMRGQLLLGYEYKEYVDLLLKVVQDNGDENLTDRQKAFFELCTQWLEEGELSGKERKAMDSYIMSKYKKEILRRKNIDIINYVKSVV